MNERRFFVTFGQQYPREPHPTFPAAHRDGWVEIVADHASSARGYALGRLGRAWSNIYPEDVFEQDRHYYPLGCLAAWRVPDGLTMQAAIRQGEQDAEDEAES